MALIAPFSLSQDNSTTTYAPIPEDPRHLPGIAGDDVFLPKLVAVDLCDIWFEEICGETNKQFYKVLPAALNQRKMMGKPIQKLRILDCKVEKTWVEAVKTIVPSVEWDGITDPDKEEETDSDEKGLLHRYVGPRGMRRF